MRHRLALAAALLATGLSHGLPAQQRPPSSAQTPVFRSGAAFVRVDVYPSKDGRIVPDLSKSDFQVFEDGKPQQIETFEYVDFPTFASEEERRDPINKEEGDAMAADPRNRVFVVYLDLFNVSIEEAYWARSPLIATLDRTIGPSDVFGVLTPKQTYTDLVFGRKVKSTADMLTRHWAWGESDFPSQDSTAYTMTGCYLGSMDESALAELIARERLDRTLRRLTDLVDYLGRLRQERKNLLLFSHGWNLAGPAEYLMTANHVVTPAPSPGVSLGGKLAINDRSRGGVPPSACEGERVRLANEDFRLRFRDLLGAARRGNVSFYPVNPAGLSADTGVSSASGVPLQVQQVEQRRRGLETAVDHLRELATNTDGIAVVDTNDLRTAMMRITDSLSAYYLIGYYPTNAKQDGSIRSITVKGPSGAEMKARRQYRAGDDKSEAAIRSRMPEPIATLAPSPIISTAEFDAAFNELARLGAMRNEITARAVMPSANEILLIAESSRAMADVADIQVLVNDARGNTVATTRGQIAAGARAVQLRAVVPASATGELQAVMRVTGGGVRAGETLSVARPSGELGDAELIRVTGTTVESTAIPVFARRERLRATWAATSAATSAMMGGAEAITRQEARVLDRRGQPLPIDAVVTTDEASGSRRVRVDVALAQLAPGDYVIELVVAAGRAETRRLLAFRVTQ